MALTTNVASALASPPRPLTVAPRVSAIEAPSSPLAATGATVGASGLTVTASLAVAVVLRLPSASRLVAATPSVKLTSLAGVMARLARFQLWTSTEVLPALAVKVCVPSLSVAPGGMALTTNVASALASPPRPLTVAPRVSAIEAPSSPLAATGATVGASGLTVTASLAVAVVLRLPSASRLVAATPSVKLTSLAGVMARLARFQLWTSTEVLPALAVKVCVPSLSVAPGGMALTTNVASALASPPRPLTVAPRVSAIEAPSSPLAATGATVGASGLTVTASLAVAVVLRLPSASRLVAATPSVKLTSLAGVMARLARFQLWTSTEVLPALAVKVCVPSLSVAPGGMALTTNVASALASPPRPLTVAPRVSAIEAPSSPLAATGATVGASGLTVTASLAVAVVLRLPSASRLVAATPSVKLTSLAGVMARLARFQLWTSTEVLPALAVKVCVPSLSVAPGGMALTTNVASALASPPRPLTVAPRVSAIEAPSSPLAATGATVGASGLTVTASLAVAVVLRLPSASRLVAATPSVKLTSLAGVMARLARFQLWTSTEVLPALAVKVCVPSLSVAPGGMALTTNVASALASPPRPLTVAPRVSAIEAPSSPLAATGATVGASGLTVTASLAVAVVLRLPSASRLVAATPSVKLTSLAGVMARLARFQLWTSTEVLPALAVKVCVPSLSVAPGGMALTTNVASALASPPRPLTVAPRVSAIEAPSSPLAATGATVGASGLTVTASLAVAVVLRLPSASRLVAATPSVKLTSLAGVMARLARFQLWTSTEVLPALAVKVCVPSLSVAPGGMALTTNVASALASPARPLTVAPRSSAIEAPSSPLAATGARLGASGLTVTASLAVAVVLRLPSASRLVAATPSVKLTSLAGVMARLARFQLWTSTEVLPALAVKVCVPSLSVAPGGMALTTNVASALASPPRPLTVAPRLSAVEAPSGPLGGRRV